MLSKNNEKHANADDLSVEMLHESAIEVLMPSMKENALSMAKVSSVRKKTMPKKGAAMGICSIAVRNVTNTSPVPQ